VFVVTAVSGLPEPGLRVGLYGDIASVKDDSTHVWKLYCLGRETGQVFWSRIVHRGVPQIKRHTKATYANATPATDGTHLVVSLGSEGLYCFDLCGNLLWRRALGLLDSGYYEVPSAQWGFGSSPIIHQGIVFVQCDVQQNSYLAAFDVCDGRELWRTARKDVPTWSTPTIVAGRERTQLVVNGFRHAGGYDPLTGQELWRLGGGGDIPVPTPVVARDLIILSSAHGGQAPLRAIRSGATGDITPGRSGSQAKSVVWSHRRDGIYMQTPLVYGQYLYACKNNGVLSCYQVESGRLVYRERLDGGVGFTASPVACRGKLYFTSEDGNVYVVAAGPTFKLLAKNVMNEVCMSTPAISDGLLILRARDHVYGIGAPPAPCPADTAECRDVSNPSGVLGRRLLGPLRGVLRTLRLR
jgi:outer membrane protein assembly factor BamB